MGRGDFFPAQFNRGKFSCGDLPSDLGTSGKPSGLARGALRVSHSAFEEKTLVSSALSSPCCVAWNSRDFRSLGKEIILFWILFCITNGSYPSWLFLPEKNQFKDLDHSGSNLGSGRKSAKLRGNQVPFLVLWLGESLLSRASVGLDRWNLRCLHRPNRL